jgi:hypothetical protein
MAAETVICLILEGFTLIIRVHGHGYHCAEVVVDINQNRVIQPCHVIARMVVEPRFELVVSQGYEKNLQMLNDITQSAFL